VIGEYLYSFKSGTTREDKIAKEMAVFAKGYEGQGIVDKAGLIPINMPNQGTMPTQTCPIQTVVAQQNNQMSFLKYNPDRVPVIEIKFEFDNSRLSENEKERIRTWGDSICESQKTYAIFGFTDGSGNPIYNRTLGLLRSSSVFDVLEPVIPSCKFHLAPPMSMGDQYQRPDQAKSRRVEIYELQ